MKNRSKELLLEFGLVSEDGIEPFYPCVRDREDVAAVCDANSKVIFLDRTDHMDLSHYEQIPEGSYWEEKIGKKHSKIIEKTMIVALYSLNLFL